jgi:hypothetical protein
VLTPSIRRCAASARRTSSRRKTTKAQLSVWPALGAGRGREQPPDDRVAHGRREEAPYHPKVIEQPIEGLRRGLRTGGRKRGRGEQQVPPSHHPLMIAP